jgi:hypothetical protein
MRTHSGTEAELAYASPSYSKPLLPLLLLPFHLARACRCAEGEGKHANKQPFCLSTFGPRPAALSRIRERHHYAVCGERVPCFPSVRARIRRWRPLVRSVRRPRAAPRETQRFNAK